MKTPAYNILSPSLFSGRSISNPLISTLRCFVAIRMTRDTLKESAHFSSSDMNDCRPVGFTTTVVTDRRSDIFRNVVIESDEPAKSGARPVETHQLIRHNPADRGY